MKEKLFIFSILFFINSPIYACGGGSCGGSDSCDSSFYAQHWCQPLCCQSLHPAWDCRCADIGMYYNYCMDRETYCNAFGNIGATPDYP